MYFGRDGEPMTLDEWSEKFKDDSYQVLARDVVGDVTVSTIWLGIDHGRRLIFETMVFGGKHDQDQRRYSTEKEAIAGHAEMVALVRSEK